MGLFASWWSAPAEQLLLLMLDAKYYKKIVAHAVKEEDSVS